MSQSVLQGNSALDLVRVSPSPVEIIGHGVSNSLDLFE